MFSVKNVEELEIWKNNGLSEWEYISNKLDPNLCLVSNLIYFPKFNKIDKYYIIDRNFDKNEFDKSLELKSNLSEVEFEKSWNLVYFYDIFANIPISIDDSIYEQIGIIMKFSWKSALEYQYPDANFGVEFQNSDTGNGPNITAWHK